MYDIKNMKETLLSIKAESQKLLDGNKIADAQSKISEGKELKTKIELIEQLESANNKITELNETVKKTEEDKDSAMNKFNDLTDKVAKLNSQIKEMQPIVDKYNQEQYDKKLNNALNYYKNKFISANGLDEFEKEEIQALIKQSIETENDEPTKVANEAKFKLNETIVDLLNVLDEENQDVITLSSINENCIDTTNLRQDTDEFEQVYGFKKE